MLSAPIRTYLVEPIPMSMVEATRKGSPLVCEALAWHGLLDPKSWVRVSKGSGLWGWGYLQTWIHEQRLEVGDTDSSLPVPTRVERQKAHKGEEWEQGPQATERLLLWAVENQPPPSSETAGVSLADLAIHHRWRFALQSILEYKWVPPDLLKVLLHQTLETPWTTGACMLVSSLAAAYQPDAPRVEGVVRTWGKKAFSPEALDGLLLALPPQMRMDEDLWEGWVLDWFKAFQEEPAAFSMVKLAADRFEAIRNPSSRQQDVLRVALELLVAICPASEVRKYARRYVRISKSHEKGVPDFLPAVIASLPSDGKLREVQELARRTAVCHAVLEDEQSSDLLIRAQQAKLYWIQAACCRRSRQWASQQLSGPWASSGLKKERRIDRLVGKRESRLEKIKSDARFSCKEIFEAIVGMQQHNEIARSLVNGSIPGWMDELSGSDPGWDFLSERLPSGGSRAVHLVRLLLFNELPRGWLKRFGSETVQGKDVDPAIGRALFLFDCKPTVSPPSEFQGKIRRAWETRDMEDPEPRHLVVAILSAMAQRGLLEIQGLLDSENLGSLGMLYTDLLESQLEKSLSPATPEARPFPRL